MRLVDRVPIAVITAAVLSCSDCSGNRFGYSGTLQPESAQIGSTIGGRVISVNASVGDRVKAGQTIVVLDGSAQRAALAAAQSQQAQAQAALDDLLAGPRPEEVTRALAAEASAKAMLDKMPHDVSVARDSVRQARASLVQALAQSRQATLAYERSERLYREGAVPAQDRDDARARAISALAAVKAAKASVTTAQTQMVVTQTASINVAQQSYKQATADRKLVQAGAREDQIEQARAVRSAARANVQAAQTNLREMTVRAPADGVIEALNLHPGDLVGPRSEVAIVREFRNPFVRIYVAQSDLGQIKVGQTVHVRSDAVAGIVFDGTVEQIDQDAQFTPRDVQTKEDRANLTFGVKVRVHDPDGRLPGGTTVEVSL